MKKISIPTCSSCPYLTHSGGFGQIQYIPKCSKLGRKLPYNESALSGNIYVQPTYVIPDWCPLENDNECKI